MAFIPAFPSKDPNDIEPKNFDASVKLGTLGNPAVLAFTVFVDGTQGCADGLLVISNVAYSTTLQRFSFVWSGGTRGQTYFVTARLTLAPNWSIEQSATVSIESH
jgi:hypothetical protein